MNPHYKNTILTHTRPWSVIYPDRAVDVPVDDDTAGFLSSESVQRSFLSFFVVLSSQLVGDSPPDGLPPIDFDFERMGPILVLRTLSLLLRQIPDFLTAFLPLNIPLILRWFADFSVLRGSRHLLMVIAKTLFQAPDAPDSWEGILEYALSDVFPTLDNEPWTEIEERQGANDFAIAKLDCFLTFLEKAPAEWLDPWASQIGDYVMWELKQDPETFLVRGIAIRSVVAALDEKGFSLPIDHHFDFLTVMRFFEERYRDFKIHGQCVALWALSLVLLNTQLIFRLPIGFLFQIILDDRLPLDERCAVAAVLRIFAQEVGLREILKRLHGELLFGDVTSIGCLNSGIKEHLASIFWVGFFKDGPDYYLKHLNRPGACRVLFAIDPPSELALQIIGLLPTTLKWYEPHEFSNILDPRSLLILWHFIQLLSTSRDPEISNALANLVSQLQIAISEDQVTPEMLLLVDLLRGENVELDEMDDDFEEMDNELEVNDRPGPLIQDLPTEYAEAFSFIPRNRIE
jgi:hypothetical protein